MDQRKDEARMSTRGCFPVLSLLCFYFLDRQGKNAIGTKYNGLGLSLDTDCGAHLGSFLVDCIRLVICLRGLMDIV